MSLIRKLYRYPLTSSSLLASICYIDYTFCTTGTFGGHQSFCTCLWTAWSLCSLVPAFRLRKYHHDISMQITNELQTSAGRYDLRSFRPSMGFVPHQDWNFAEPKGLDTRSALSCQTQEAHGASWSFSHLAQHICELHPTFLLTANL